MLILWIQITRDRLLRMGWCFEGVRCVSRVEC